MPEIDPLYNPLPKNTAPLQPSWDLTVTPVHCDCSQVCSKCVELSLAVCVDVCVGVCDVLMM